MAQDNTRRGLRARGSSSAVVAGYCDHASRRTADHDAKLPLYAHAHDRRSRRPARRRRARRQQPPYRTLDDKFAPPKFTDAAQWKARAAYLREHMLATAGLLPMPGAHAARGAGVRRAQAQRLQRRRRSTSRACRDFWSPATSIGRSATGRFPAVLAPHGHWAYGRLENTTLNSVPGRAINLARQGFVVFTYDMVGYDDSRQLPHTFGGKREALWGLSLGRPAAVELDPQPRLPAVAALRPARRAGGDRRVGRRDADVPARRGRRSRQGRGAGQHDLAAHAGRLPVRERAGACGSTPTTSKSPRQSRRGRC